jgi:hypothetical protein
MKKFLIVPKNFCALPVFFSYGRREFTVSGGVSRLRESNSLMIWMSSVVIFCFVLAEVPSTFLAEVSLAPSTLTASLVRVIMVDLSLAVISRISVQYDWKFYIKTSYKKLNLSLFLNFFMVMMSMDQGSKKLKFVFI